MSITCNAPLRPWRRWLLSAAVWLFLAITLTLVVMIALGLTNPQPIGEVVLMDTPSVTMFIENPEHHLDIPSEYMLTPPGSVEVTMAHLNGPTEASYGVTVFPDPQRPREGISVLISSNGFIAVSNHTDPIMLPQRWPHIRGLGQANTIRINISETQVNVWVNQEFAAAFERTIDGPLHVGYIGKTLGSGGFGVEVQAITITQE